MNDDDILNLKKTFADEDTILARNIVSDCETALEGARTSFGAECKEEARQRCFRAIVAYQTNALTAEVRVPLQSDGALQHYANKKIGCKLENDMLSVVLELQEYRKTYGPLGCQYLTRKQNP